MHGQTALDVGKYLHETKNGGISVKQREQLALVAECRGSGMTAKAWCELKGIEYHRYIAWASRLKTGKVNISRSHSGSGLT